MTQAKCHARDMPTFLRSRTISRISCVMMSGGFQISFINQVPQNSRLNFGFLLFQLPLGVEDHSELWLLCRCSCHFRRRVFRNRFRRRCFYCRLCCFSLNPQARALFAHTFPNKGKKFNQPVFSRCLLLKTFRFPKNSMSF